MKKINLLLVLAFLTFTAISCDSDDDEDLSRITFEGAFSREFDVEGFQQRATYTINQDNISYELTGGIGQASYTIEKEYFSSSENRWVGYRESNSTFYIVFFKDISDSEFSLYKKEVSSLAEGKTEPIPLANDTENHGWNIYKKDLPISGRVSNLNAPNDTIDYTQNPPVVSEVKPFHYFSFEEGVEVTENESWDIAFKGTTIITNSGVSGSGDAASIILNGTFAEILEAPEDSEFSQDSETVLAIPSGSGNGWYNYNGATHQITPIPGKIIVVKTNNGNYAKIEIVSYYKDLTTAESPYYTFNYMYQPNGSKALE